MTCGIYMIMNNKTGQKYIGQAFDIEQRWYRHIHNPNLQHSRIDRALNKYGDDIFSLHIVDETEKDKLNEREEFWVEKYNTFKNKKHYNLTKGGDRGPSLYGDRNPMKRPEVALKISKIKTGKKLSQETKEKISRAKKGKSIWKNKKHPMKGKRHANESKIKISKSTNTSGYYRVTKLRDKRCKQGYTWAYQYDGKTIKNVNIKTLEDTVKKRGLPWLKFKEDEDNVNY